MRFEYKPSFASSLKSLPSREKEEVKKATLLAIDILSQDRHIHKGIGLKHLRGDFWEVRRGIRMRIIFRWQRDLVEFVLAGDHNDIKRFLKNI